MDEKYKGIKTYLPFYIKTSLHPYTKHFLSFDVFYFFPKKAEHMREKGKRT